MASTPPCVPIQRKHSWSPVPATCRHLAIIRPTYAEPQTHDSGATAVLTRSIRSAKEFKMCKNEYELLHLECAMHIPKREAIFENEASVTSISAFRAVKNRKEANQEISDHVLHPFPF